MWKLELSGLPQDDEYFINLASKYSDSTKFEQSSASSNSLAIEFEASEYGLSIEEDHEFPITDPIDESGINWFYLSASAEI